MNQAKPNAKMGLYLQTFSSEWIRKRMNDNIKFLAMISLGKGNGRGCVCGSGDSMQLSSRLCFENKQSKVNKYLENSGHIWVVVEVCVWSLVHSYTLHFINTRSYCVRSVLCIHWCGCVSVLFFIHIGFLVDVYSFSFATHTSEDIFFLYFFVSIWKRKKCYFNPFGKRINVWNDENGRTCNIVADMHSFLFVNLSYKPNQCVLGCSNGTFFISRL